MKKIIHASLAAGFVIASASAASALTYEQSTDFGAYENGGVGTTTQMQVDRTHDRDRGNFFQRGQILDRGALNLNATPAQPDIQKNDPSKV